MCRLQIMQRRRAGQRNRRVEIKIYNSYNSNVSGTSTDDTGTETPADAALSTETVTDTPEAATTGATVEPTEAGTNRKGSIMKKNLLTVIILALVLVNLILTAVLAFSVIPQTKSQTN